jgi:hypothetical protein
MLIQMHADDWNIRESDVDRLIALKAAFDAAQDLSDARGTRTSVTIAAAQMAREALEEQMRYIRQVYLDPGLKAKIISRSQYLEIGLSLPDTTHTTQPDPEDHVDFALRNDGRDHSVRGDFRITGSTSRSKAPYHGAEVYTIVLPLDAPAPTTTEGEGWHSEVCTATPWKRTFGAHEIGKRLYVAMRWENRSVGKNGERRGKGPWSAIQSIVIA